MPTSLDASEVRAHSEAESSPAPERAPGRRARSRSIRLLRVTRREAQQAVERALELEAQIDDRPRTRQDCIEGPRPCPHVSCRHHLYLDVNPQTGTIKLNFPDLEVWELANSCALDIADQGGTAIETVGDFMNVTRERIRQIETQALTKLSSGNDHRALREFKLD
ncbi:MAG TPA: sigma factor-like helix-turn-helix DNA-binding protein [Polyangiaceae bacterium]|nr:sigma factor-like helix-turn-helix DNA-binding protein [Polyangiaceae bacterium]